MKWWNIKEYDNLFVLCGFSKLCSMTGHWIGYVPGNFVEGENESETQRKILSFCINSYS